MNLWEKSQIRDKEDCVLQPMKGYGMENGE